MPSDEQSRKVILIALGITAVFGIITFALAAAILGGQNKRFSNIDWSLEELTKTSLPPPLQSLPPQLQRPPPQVHRLSSQLHTLP
ncbi:unnamed protein product [Rotaria magnacalcarata]|uniref:Uncharacterized protein n=1 Tax=Rotaria magnacalcarata TaxID=392030 RepID=A0A815B8N2_9BILA|nr:unnamed protein product [Rotaria magnacalcarata]